jgi:hypothetical protein
MIVYRGSDIGADQFFSMTKLRFPPEWLHLPKNTARKESILHYKIRLLSDESIRNKTKHI